MGKQTNMVLLNKKKSRDKVLIAITAINEMLRKDEQVVVCKLVRKTGLSRAFFYNNEKVHSELRRAQELQEGISFVAPQQVALDKAMDKEIELLRKKIEEKDKTIENLQKELSKLRKIANNQTIKALEDL